MIYRVIMDGNDILNYQERQYVLINPSLEMELNTAGSFEFTMPPSHGFYSDVHPLLSTIEVYEDEELLWFGRPIEVKTDYYKNRQVYCEGALAFFNDSVQRLHAFKAELAEETKRFSTVIANAFDTNIREALAGSVELARKVGVKEEEILKSTEDIDDFFLG